jgi:hypothetical protein
MSCEVALRSLYPGGNNPITYFTEGWVDSTAGLEDCKEEKKILVPNHPASRYRGYAVIINT